MDMKAFSLEGKVALITGAAYGIGFAIAEAFAAAGAKICFNCRGEHSIFWLGFKRNWYSLGAFLLGTGLLALILLVPGLHSLFSVQTVSGFQLGMIALLAVLPTVVIQIIKLAKEAGYAGIVLMGEPYYYPRFGFERGAKYGLTDPEGNVFDALMCLPLNDDFSGIKGKIVESRDFDKLEDKERLAEINKEFPKYRVVKVQEGFMQIFEQHLGVVESIESDTYMVRYWELLIPTKLSENLNATPEVGSDVQFTWNHKDEGKSMITKVFKNLLE